MANKLIKRRYNNLLTARNNYYGLGSSLKTAFGKEGSGWGVLGGITGGATNSILSGGMSSGAGNLISGLSGIASAIPGPWGAAIGAGLQVVGGLTNRMFGSKMNTENIAKIESNINSLNNFQSNASDFDTLAQNWANADTGMTFSDSFVGKDGWFSNKAKNKAADLRRQVEAGNTWVQNTLANNAENISNTQMQDLLANYTAYGGPLFAEGGRIHIKPENRGKFTETKRRTGKTTEELTHSKNPLTRRRAIFAQNAKKWHHAFGGDLMTHGATFDTGVTLIGNGGTHEENPNEGVQMGMDAEGVPNLVEEGEVIFNDYVFSKRLKVPKAVRKKYKLMGSKPLTFADAAIQMSKESEERPNDPISQAGLEDNMTKLMIAQESLREKTGKSRSFARGGKMGRLYAGLSTDPYANTLMRGFAITPFEGPNPIYVRGGAGYDSGYIPPKPVVSGNIVNPAMHYATTPPPVTPEIEGGPVLENLVPSSVSQVSAAESKEARTNPIKAQEIAKRAALGNMEEPKYEPTWMRYTPAFTSGIMSLTDVAGLTNKPDYGEANAVLEAARNAGKYNPVRFRTVGNYLTDNPLDRDYYTNKLNAEASAARRALLNTSGGNRAQAMAGILAADYNTQSKMGDLFRQAEEYNLAQRQKVEEFNRATNMFNSEGIFKADSANQAAQLNARDFYLKGLLSASELRQRERQAAIAARSANLSNFINSLGDIGRENFSRNMIIGDPSKYYWVGPNGAIHYKAAYDKLSADEKKEVDKEIVAKRKSANGGYLTRRKRRR